jgi:Holliday junction resolvase-like predicted endonuclease
MLKSDPSTWKDPRHRLGARAEQSAAEALRVQGYQVLEQRFRYRRTDVDIVARRGAVIVFVEVKSRSDGRYGQASDAVRFDVITVSEGKLEWLQDAFRPGWR